MMERDILQALQTATIQAVAAGSIPTLPIAFLGRTFVIPNDGKWLEIVHIPNNRTSEYWDDARTFQGLYRLLLHWPKDDAGVYAPMDVINSIAAFFTKEKALRNGQAAVKIYDNPDMMGLITTDKDQIFPVNIAYRNFKEPT